MRTTRIHSFTPATQTPGESATPPTSHPTIRAITITGADVGKAKFTPDNAAALSRAGCRFLNRAGRVRPVRSGSPLLASDISDRIDYAPYLKPAGTTVSLSDIPTKATDKFGLAKDDPRVAAFLGQASARFNFIKKVLNALQNKRVLIVFEGLDAHGKGGLIETLGLELPGITSYAFKKPTPEEMAEHYLDRIRRRLPQKGEIGIFDRSYYEDYIVPKALGQLPDAETRLHELEAFEKELEAEGTVIIRLYAHASAKQQYEELMERLLDFNGIEDPAEKIKGALRNLKLQTSDWKVRARRDTFLKAVEESMGFAEWLVIPNDSRWLGRLILCKYVLDRLEALMPELEAELFAKADARREAFTQEIEAEGIELK